MKIGELAREHGCAVETIRYYEKIGLLPPSRRLPNGYRVYDTHHKQWLRFILKSRSLGFNQAQVMRLTQLADGDSQSCSRVHRVIVEHLAEVKEKQRELKQRAEALIRLEQQCRTARKLSCPVIDELMREE